MKQAGTGHGGRSGGMSPAEALRFYREFKKLREKAGIPPYDPKDRDAIRKGFFGDYYNKPRDMFNRSRSTRQPS